MKSQLNLRSTFPAASLLGGSRSAGLGLPLTLCALFLLVLWVAGGASRGDVLGQTMVRGAAWFCLCSTALFARRPVLGDAWPVAVFLALALMLALIQLVPMPPAIWQALPGRTLLIEAAAVAGEAQPWRPIAIVPDATRNAAWSLAVPVAMMTMMATIRGAERSWLPGMLLGLIVASTLLALLQFSGSRINNPLINDSVGQISASFANRNHLALFLAIGCALAPAWAFLHGRGAIWRTLIALGMVLLFILTILATGSRAGLLLGVIASTSAILLVWSDLRRQMRHYSRWMLPAFGCASIGVIAAVVLVAFSTNRAMSLNRVVEGSISEDMRGRALPTVLDMIRTYFPAGSGVGGFDPIFRIHEPIELLKLTYFNHAHNDFLEVALDAGLPGILLLLAAIGWWMFASLGAWRAGSHALLPRLGSVIVGLVLVASIFDYPARTPMIMAVTVISAWWLADTALRRERALRIPGEHL